MVYRLKHSFSAGELSPLMDARLDFKRYASGCSKLLNMVCTTQGPGTRRSGFRFIYSLNDIGLDLADPRVRAIPFIFNENQAYALIFYMHTNGFPRMVVGTANGLVVHGDPVQPFCPPVPYTVPYTGVGIYNIPVDIGAASEVQVRHTSSGGTETTLVLTTNYTITINTDPTADTINVTSGPTSSDGTLDFYIINSKSPGDVVELILPDTWDIEEFDWAQSADEMYIAQSGLPPHSIKRYGHECWALDELAFVSQPADWSDDYGWPERVTFHQQRVAFAANLLKRQTVWMSQAGDFSSFATSTPVVDSDAVTFTLDSGTQNKIIWMNSAKSLNIGTIGNEWTVKGATQSALTPTNILAERQTNNGGEANKPLMVGVTTLFVERHGRIVNEFVYDYTFDSYKTSDMSILAPHLTELYSIIDWTYQQTPDSVIWGIRSDGVLLGITYQRQHEVIGWHQHTTDGKFKAITSIPGEGREDEVWAIINRTIDGNEVYYVEKMFEAFKSTDSLDARFLDSSVLYEGAATDTITGLDHLEGESVAILADGTVHPNVTVNSGSITLNDEYSTILVGLNYISEIWPLPPDAAGSEGTNLGRMQRVRHVLVDLYRSLGMEIGREDSEDGEYAETVPFRIPGDVTGTRVPLFTGIKKIDFPEGYDRQTKYFVRQRQPLPLTLRAAVDVVEFYE